MGNIETLKTERDRVAKYLEKLDPGSDKYEAATGSLRFLDDEILKAEKVEAEIATMRYDKENMDDKLHIEQQRLDFEKKHGWWDIAARFIGGILGVGIPCVFSIIGIDRTVRKEEIEYSVPNRDAFSLARNMQVKPKF